MFENVVRVRDGEGGYGEDKSKESEEVGNWGHD